MTFKKYLKSNKAQSTVEYVVLFSIMVFVSIIFIAQVKPAVFDKYITACTAAILGGG